MQVNSNLEVLTFSATTRCAAAFFDDFAAPIILFFGIKGLKGFSTMIASVENWKPAKKDKVNQVFFFIWAKFHFDGLSMLSPMYGNFSMG